MSPTETDLAHPVIRINRPSAIRYFVWGGTATSAPEPYFDEAVRAL